LEVRCVLKCELRPRKEAARKVEEAFLRALDIVERIERSGVAEYEGFFTGLGGGYVEPGASGALTRGRVEVLPTGRNFYAVDPTTLPTPGAWKVGVETAEKLIKYYLEKHGRYPESVGQVLWSIDGYKADGEQLAQILYLLGVRPVWRPDGSVKELEVIPLGELKRPRIDCVVRMSGIVRDTLPNYVHLMDEAVAKVASLDEPLDMNYVRKHYVEHVSKLMKMGKGEAEARDAALFRVFCEPPGSYGAGVNLAVEASAWRSDEDLAKTWIQWAGYAYSRRHFGKPAPESLVLSLSAVDVVNRNHVSDEHDIFGCCCYFAYHGGFFNAVKALTGRDDVEIVTVDTRDVSSTQVRGMKDEIERVVRAKLLNPVWIDEMKKHGYRGANEFSRKILHLYGWSATSKLVDKWVFDEIAKTYALDEEMRRWFEENNVWALEEIARRLIEAAERGLWRPSEELLERLREVYGEVEGVLEESIGEGAVQGGAIQVYTSEDDEHWKERLVDVEKAISLLRKAG
jgi:cobaltochelatase CobN